MIYDESLLEVVKNMLPEKLEHTTEYAMLSDYHMELNGNLLIYHRVSYCPSMSTEIEWPLAEDDDKYCWAARCRCTACENEWYSGWLRGGGLLMYSQDYVDETYVGVPEIGEENIIAVEEGDDVLCPYCEEIIVATPKSKLRHGRSYQIMVCEPRSMEFNGLKHTLLMYWILRRTINERGTTCQGSWPAFAVLIDEYKDVNIFSHCKNNGYGKRVPGKEWKAVYNGADPFFTRYHQYDAANHTAIGGFMYHRPNFAGETTEKTGLGAYLNSNGNYPLQYLYTWKRFKNLENIMKTDLGKTITLIMDREWDSEQSHGEKPKGTTRIASIINLAHPRPCDMLSMTPYEFKAAQKWDWDADGLLLWRNCVGSEIFAPGQTAEYKRLVDLFGFANFKEIVNRIENGHDYSFSRVESYLRRQERKNGISIQNGARMLIDYHEMLDQRDVEPIEDELYPNNLRTAHDTAQNWKNGQKDKQYQRQFNEIASKWAGLEYSDGDICAVLPKSNGELITEGRKLKHCVGGYGHSHIAGKLIIFIRHSRRPERSWFTLNIDMTGTEPKRVQLHGYGNEHAHGKTLKIPQRVLDFCDKFEREIVPDVFKQVKAQEEAEKREARKKRKKKEVKAA